MEGEGYIKKPIKTYRDQGTEVPGYQKNIRDQGTGVPGYQEERKWVSKLALGFETESGAGFRNYASTGFRNSGAWDSKLVRQGFETAGWDSKLDLRGIGNCLGWNSRV